MKSIKNRYLSAIVIGIFAIIYSVLVFVLKDMDNAGGNFWGGYIFTMLAFILTVVLTCLTKLSQTKTIATQATLHLGAYVYLGINLVVNTIFISLDKDTNTTAMVLINIVLLLVFVAYEIVSFMGIRHTSVASEKVVEKRQNTQSLEIKVSALIYSAKTQPVKDALVKLSEDVKYGARMGSDASQQAIDAEEAFKDKLCVIEDLLRTGADDEAVLSAIADAVNAFKLRNEIAIKFR